MSCGVFVLHSFRFSLKSGFLYCVRPFLLSGGLLLPLLLPAEFVGTLSPPVDRRKSLKQLAGLCAGEQAKQEPRN